jgi:hypothetical protein
MNDCYQTRRCGGAHLNVAGTLLAAERMLNLACDFTPGFDKICFLPAPHDFAGNSAISSPSMDSAAWPSSLGSTDALMQRRYTNRPKVRAPQIHRHHIKWHHDRYRVML